MTSRWPIVSSASVPGGAWSRPRTVYGPSWACSRCGSVGVQCVREPRGGPAFTAHSSERRMRERRGHDLTPVEQPLEQDVDELDLGLCVELVGEPVGPKVEAATDQAVPGEAGEVDEHLVPRRSVVRVIVRWAPGAGTPRRSRAQRRWSARRARVRRGRVHSRCVWAVDTCRTPGARGPPGRPGADDRDR